MLIVDIAAGRHSCVVCVKFSRPYLNDEINSLQNGAVWKGEREMIIFIVFHNSARVNNLTLTLNSVFV